MGRRRNEVPTTFTPRVAENLTKLIERHDWVIRRIKKASETFSSPFYETTRRSLGGVIGYHTDLDAEIHFFGSRLVGVSTWRSDLDFYVDVGNSFCEPPDEDKAVYVLKKIMKAIKKSKNWQYKILIPNSAVPLLRVIYKPLNLECDITACNGLSVCTSRIMRHLFDIQDEAVGLFHFIRIWLFYNDIRMKRFVQVLLIIFFLQRHNYMPTIKQVLKNLPVKRVDGYEVQYDSTRTLSDYSAKKIRNYEPLVKEFFKFYAHFDFDNNALSLIDGKIYNKNSFEDCFKSEKPLCIVAPLEYNRNASPNVSKKQIDNFKNVCEMSVPFLNDFDF